MESQLQTVFIWVQVMTHLLLQWFRITQLHSLSTQQNRNSLCNCMFMRGKLSYIHVLLDESGIITEVFIPY